MASAPSFPPLPSMSYSDDKKQLLALAHERKAEGFAPDDLPTPSVVRTMVSEVRAEQGALFVTFRLPEERESRYCLCQYAGSKADGYAALRQYYPEAHVRFDHRNSRKRGAGESKWEPSQRAETDRRNARKAQAAHRAQEKTGGDLEVFWRLRVRLAESIENVLSIPESLMASEVPVDQAESLLEDLNDLAAYTDTLISLIHGKLDDAAFVEKLEKLRNIDGRSPEEAAAFLTQAAKLERKRLRRLPS